MKEPDNYSELLQSVRTIAEHCEMITCKDCPFVDAVGLCVLQSEPPCSWYDWLPEERSEEQ